jgi:hypothetical protein
MTPHLMSVTKRCIRSINIRSSITYPDPTCNSRPKSNGDRKGSTQRRPSKRLVFAHKSQLYIYPIKSFLPIEVNEATILECGLQYDRQYVLVHFPEDKAGELEVLTIKTKSNVRGPASSRS